MAQEIVSGMGVRYGLVIPLDADGLPAVSVKQAAPHYGTLVEGIKTWARTDGQIQRVTHYGDDSPFAQDSLPPQEAGSYQFTTAKTNIYLDAAVEGNKVVSAGRMKMRAGNTDKKGNEPQVAFFGYRQALDTDKDSPTSGKLRQWHGAVYSSSRITSQSQSMEQSNTVKTYDGTPSPSTLTPWGEVQTEATYGNNRGEYIETISDYQPRWSWHLGNGTRTSFELTHPPVDATADYLHVWVGGTLQTSFAGVNTSLANPSFTLTAPAGNNLKVVEIVETNVPGVL